MDMRQVVQLHASVEEIGMRSARWTTISHGVRYAQLADGTMGLEAAPKCVACLGLCGWGTAGSMPVMAGLDTCCLPLAAVNSARPHPPCWPAAPLLFVQAAARRAHAHAGGGHGAAHRPGRPLLHGQVGAWWGSWLVLPAAECCLR